MLRPDLFTAAVLRVPFSDALTCMVDPIIPLTVHERDEWGDPATDVQVWTKRGGGERRTGL